jgi:hypothetical protein
VIIPEVHEVHARATWGFQMLAWHLQQAQWKLLRCGCETYVLHLCAAREQPFKALHSIIIVIMPGAAL